MPISKHGKLYFTDEQYQVARETSALEYARAAGYGLVAEGHTYHLRDHDSMIFTQDGAWHWNSQSLHGRAIEFITGYEQKSLVAAVLILAGEQDAMVRPYQAPPAEQAKKPFELPQRAGNFRRLFAYLCGTRKLDVGIVQELVHQRRVYEGVHTYTKEGKHIELHNAVFVGFGQDGQPKSAFQRGLSTLSSPFKGDVIGSEKTVPFCIPSDASPDTVAVFEAAIDAISHATLAKQQGEHKASLDRIVLGGFAYDGLLQYLQLHPTVKNICLCLDNDPAGEKGVAYITEALANHGYTRDAGYTITVEFPPFGKDWNEYLIHSQTAPKRPSQGTP